MEEAIEFRFDALKEENLILQSLTLMPEALKVTF
jgi:hypothetical protein